MGQHLGRHCWCEVVPIAFSPSILLSAFGKTVPFLELIMIPENLSSSPGPPLYFSVCKIKMPVCRVVGSFEELPGVWPARYNLV
jgi:hypothetical protein